MAEAWIIDAVRTPRGKGKKATADKPGGALAETHPQALAATCFKPWLSETLSTQAKWTMWSWVS